MYREIREMPDSPERRKKYESMAKWITGKCPWIFESHPVSFLLQHGWLENYIPNDFVFSKWKYLSVNPARREALRKTFKPLSFAELNGQ